MLSQERKRTWHRHAPTVKARASAALRNCGWTLVDRDDKVHYLSYALAQPSELNFGNRNAASLPIRRAIAELTTIAERLAGQLARHGLNLLPRCLRGVGAKVELDGIASITDFDPMISDLIGQVELDEPSCAVCKPQGVHRYIIELDVYSSLRAKVDGESALSNAWIVNLPECYRALRLD
jgi:hypothetical protein